MSRRKKAIRRHVRPDPRYDSQTVSKFVCNLMERGKKSLAERVFYSAMDLIEQRTGQPGGNVFKQALSNVKPALEVKSRRGGGATDQVAGEGRPERRTGPAVRGPRAAGRVEEEGVCGSKGGAGGGAGEAGGGGGAAGGRGGGGVGGVARVRPGAREKE